MSKRVRYIQNSDKSRAISIGRVKRSDLSRQVDNDDPFAGSTPGISTIIGTPFSMLFLDRTFEQSNVLPQCVDAIITNVVSGGYKVIPIGKEEEVDDKEVDVLNSYIQSANPEESLRTVTRSVIHDYEKYGFGFYEIIRNRRREVSLIKSAKSLNIRIYSKGEVLVPVKISILRGGSRSPITEFKRFRKYEQRIGSVLRYFKEFGDVRKMDFETGQYEDSNFKVARDREATELLHRRQISEDSYGIPRWISQLPTVLGSRELEEVNLRYFEDNTIPPAIISVAGGRLTASSFLQLKKLLQEQGIGKDRQNKILLLEAIPEIADLDAKGTVKLQVDKLTDARQSDGLFKDYDSSNMEKIMSSFRLSPIVLGKSQSINFATANIAAYLAESQVFGPERSLHDEFINKRLINHPNGLGLSTVKLQSKSPQVTSPEQIIKTLTATNVMGGITPRVSIDMVNETLQLSIPQYPDIGEEGYKEWMDTPMPLTLRQVVRNPQTGEGEDLADDQSSKDNEIDLVEDEGNIMPVSPENGQQ